LRNDISWWDRLAALVDSPTLAQSYLVGNTDDSSIDNSRQIRLIQLLGYSDDIRYKQKVSLLCGYKRPTTQAHSSPSLQTFDLLWSGRIRPADSMVVFESVSTDKAVMHFVP
jgi:hypothetical protein